MKEVQFKLVRGGSIPTRLEEVHHLTSLLLSRTLPKVSLSLTLLYSLSLSLTHISLPISLWILSSSTFLHFMLLFTKQTYHECPSWGCPGTNTYTFLWSLFSFVFSPGVNVDFISISLRRAENQHTGLVYYSHKRNEEKRTYPPVEVPHVSPLAKSEGKQGSSP